jgi:hypothetical protein
MLGAGLVAGALTACNVPCHAMCCRAATHPSPTRCCCSKLIQGATGDTSDFVRALANPVQFGMQMPVVTARTTRQFQQVGGNAGWCMLATASHTLPSCT